METERSRRSRCVGLLTGSHTAFERISWTLAVTSLLLGTVVTDESQDYHNQNAIVPPRIAKRVTDFDPRWITECPEFPNRLVLLPHPTDCVKFYYCVYGRPILYVCPPPLHFSPILNLCDWPSRAGCTTKPVKPTTTNAPVTTTTTTTKPKTTKKPCKLRTTTKPPADDDVTTEEGDLYTTSTDLATIEGSGL